MARPEWQWPERRGLNGSGLNGTGLNGAA